MKQICPRCHWFVFHSNDFQGADFAINYSDVSAETKSHKLPLRIGSNPNHYLCQSCDERFLCYNEIFPETTCYTCCHATLTDKCEWECDRCDAVPPQATQLNGCPGHIFLPDLMPWDAIDGDADWILYHDNDRLICNCAAGGFPPVTDGHEPPAFYSSAELSELGAVNRCTPEVDMVKNVFEGVVNNNKGVV